ncbi:VanZ family protein [Rummeliibacillus sp. TYF005]|uniref:VanZ family protein n=1 Tax=unclassified Rummeliibacillus TaxID=2622809 RepID=UPI000E662349|nr:MULTISPECIES: VanZ family protein [unclassified Rummeliibacillus]RIJ66398.1 VanZ family protein [Rummeliibacillus sp. POC4]RPJ94794.1 VanZ family protein [Rummeliibacillus sp. TYF005]
MKKFLNLGYWIVLLFYLYLLIDTVFFARDARRSINLTPFDMIAEQGFTLNVWGNILMFIPLGIYFANWMKKFHFWKVLGAVIGTSLGIEVLQYIFKRGASDIDDLLLNSAGGLIGILIYLVLKVIFKSKERVHVAISILSIVVGIPVILLTIILFVYN